MHALRHLVEAKQIITGETHLHPKSQSPKISAHHQKSENKQGNELLQSES